jgi:hypothetical protein
MRLASLPKEQLLELCNLGGGGCEPLLCCRQSNSEPPRRRDVDWAQIGIDRWQAPWAVCDLLSLSVVLGFGGAVAAVVMMLCSSQAASGT